MLHVSFAHTALVFANRTKTETRRFWKPRHAALFKPGTVFMGLDKDLRAGGQRLHTARVVFCYPQLLKEMSWESFLREGGEQYWVNKEEFIEAMGGPDQEPYVLRFQHCPEVGRALDLVQAAENVLAVQNGNPPLLHLTQAMTLDFAMLELEEAIGRAREVLP